MSDEFFRPPAGDRFASPVSGVVSPPFVVTLYDGTVADRAEEGGSGGNHLLGVSSVIGSSALGLGASMPGLAAATPAPSASGGVGAVTILPLSFPLRRCTDVADRAEGSCLVEDLLILGSFTTASSTPSAIGTFPSGLWPGWTKFRTPLLGDVSVGSSSLWEKSFGLSSSTLGPLPVLSGELFCCDASACSTSLRKESAGFPSSTLRLLLARGGGSPPDPPRVNASRVPWVWVPFAPSRFLSSMASQLTMPKRAAVVAIISWVCLLSPDRAHRVRAC